MPYAEQKALYVAANSQVPPQSWFQAELTYNDATIFNLVNSLAGKEQW